MKIDTNVATVDGNMAFEETTPMTFDPKSHVFLIEVLTNLYSNAELAVLREYPSNGLDSHALAGQTRPVELTLPSTLNPNFVVKDFGIGMSKDDLNNIYSRYGASTKRDSNTQIGGFGLGAKSALTITPHFTIISVKDGERNVVLISKGENGVGALNFISTTPTDEANGVEVIIPIKNIFKFLAESKLFFLGVNPKDMLIDGNQIEDSVYNTEKWTDLNGAGWFNIGSLKDRPGYSAQSVTVKVGPVLYKLDNNTGNLYNSYNSILGKNGNAIVINVNIGDVDLTPSRESLRYTEKTVANIREAITRYEKNLLESIAGLFESIDDRADAARFFNSAEARGFKLERKWHGEDIPTEIVFPDGALHYASSVNGRKTSTSAVKKIQFVDLTSSVNSANRYRVSVADVAGKDRVFKNIKDYAKSIGQSSMFIYSVMDNVELDVWFKEVVEEADAQTIYEGALEYRREQRKKNAKTSTATGERAASQPTSYFMYDTATRVVPSKVAAVDIDDEVLFIKEETASFGNLVRQVRNDPNGVNRNAAQMALLNTLLPNRHIVFLPSTISFDRFLKLFPNATEITPVLLESVKEWKKNLTEDQKAYVFDTIQGAHNGRAASYYVRIIADNRIEDVKNRIVRSRILTHADSTFVQTAAIMNFLTGYQYGQSKLKGEYISTKPKKEKSINFDVRYPLLAVAGAASTSVSTDHIIGYMNLADSAKV